MNLRNILERLFKREKEHTPKTVCPVCRGQVYVQYTDDFFDGKTRQMGCLMECSNGHYSVHVDGRVPVVLPSDYQNLHIAYEKAVYLADFGRKWDEWQDSIYDSEQVNLNQI